MDDLISRREATNELWSLNDQCDSIYYTKCIHDAVYALEILPSAQRWVPCSERLPEKDGLYIVSVINDRNRRYSKTCWYHGHEKWFARQDVVAWMPLPEPYRKDGDENV